MAEKNTGFFGISFGNNKKDKKAEKKKSFVEPTSEDNISVIGNAGGHFSQGIEIGDKIKNENDLILKYRAAAQHPDVDAALDDIVSEAIVHDETGKVVSISLDDTELSDNIKNTIIEEFNTILNILKFNSQGHDIFKKWYVDGRLPYHKVVDEKRIKDGILELRYIDPLKIKKVRKKITEKDQNSQSDLIKGVEEFYVYQDKNFRMSDTNNTGTGLKIHRDSIAFVTSGITDPSKTQILSNLHKSLKPLNQLTMLETATVIYRLARAPERRAFYVDVGNLPTGKAEEYLTNMMNKYRNKIVYDANSGEIKDQTNHMSILDDFWLPRREGSRGTEIDTLSGGQSLGDIEDILYFRKKLLKSLMVPMSRQEQEAQFSFGRTGEITRDEIKFHKFIARLRKRFSLLFYDLLKTQLILKGIMSEEEWFEIKEDISFEFHIDNHYSELKETEILRERLSLIAEIEPHIGTFFSSMQVKRDILKMSDEDIKQLDKEIKAAGDDKDLADFEEGADSDVLITQDDINEASSAELKLALANYLKKK